MDKKNYFQLTLIYYIICKCICHAFNGTDGLYKYLKIL